MSERRGARGYEKKIPRHGDYGGPLCGVIAVYEDGTEISFHCSMEGLPLEDLPPSQPKDAPDKGTCPHGSPLVKDGYCQVCGLRME